MSFTFQPAACRSLGIREHALSRHIRPRLESLPTKPLAHALAIAFAHGHPGIDLVGVTTVAGNVGLAKTTENALAVCEFIGAAVQVAFTM